MLGTQSKERKNKVKRSKPTESQKIKNNKNKIKNKKPKPNIRDYNLT